MKKIFFLAALFSISMGSIFVTSCSKTDDMVLTSTGASPSNQDDLLYEGMEITYIDSLVDMYSKVLAKSLNNNELRMVVKNMALRMFDGDYDILCTELQNVSLNSTGRTVAELLAASYSSIFQGSGADFLDEVNNSLPNLQVAVPIHIDRWDPAGYRPFVDPLPMDLDDRVDVMVEGYDGTLSRIHVSSQHEPDFPVIVVGVSERVDIKGVLINGPYGEPKPIGKIPSPVSNLICEYTTAANAVRLRWPVVEGATGYEVYQTNDLGNDVVIGTTSGSENIFNSTGLETCRTYQYMVRAFNDAGLSSFSNFAEITATDRCSGSPLRVKSFRFSDSGLNSVECWLRGGPEVQLRVIKSNLTGTGSDILKATGTPFEPSRRQAKSTYYCDYAITSSWTQSRYNDVLDFEWREEDNRFPITIHVKASYTGDTLRTLAGMVNVNASTEFDVSTDSHIASHKVCFWDPKEYQYGSLPAGFVFNTDANL